MTTFNNNVPKGVIPLMGERDLLKDKIRRLKKGLEKFAQHHSSCTSNQIRSDCSCGLTALIKLPE